MGAQQERADQEVVNDQDSGAIAGIDQALTPLQYHYLSLLQRLIVVKNSYQTLQQTEDRDPVGLRIGQRGNRADDQ